MKVLVTVASRHQATRGIAEMIAEELKTSGLDVDLYDAADVPDLGAYEAVILGSAVYTGGWLPAARHLVDFQEPALRKVPVWLFSSGPIGDR
jgi:menaquinone-dependent protoporphyrinogen oxidase